MKQEIKETLTYSQTFTNVNSGVPLLKLSNFILFIGAIRSFKKEYEERVADGLEILIWEGKRFARDMTNKVKNSNFI